VGRKRTRKGKSGETITWSDEKEQVPKKRVFILLEEGKKKGGYFLPEGKSPIPSPPEENPHKRGGENRPAEEKERTISPPPRG